jgi:hypothetical protein
MESIALIGQWIGEKRGGLKGSKGQGFKEAANNTTCGEKSYSVQREKSEGGANEV